MRHSAFCICENIGSDQRRGHRAAYQRLCICYKGTSSTITQLPRSIISSLPVIIYITDRSKAVLLFGLTVFASVGVGCCAGFTFCVSR